LKNCLKSIKRCCSKTAVYKEEITNLNTKLGVSEHRAIPVGRSDNLFVDSLFPTPNVLLEVSEHVSVGKTLQSNISGTSDPKDKIELYMSLFKGRDDVYAKRWDMSNCLQKKSSVKEFLK